MYVINNQAKPQVVAYNKMDTPESADYWDITREALLEAGVPPDRLFAVSAASGQGVPALVRRVRALLDEMGPAPTGAASRETDAPNVQRPQDAKQDARLDDFDISLEDDGGGGAAAAAGSRTFYVSGAAIERFTAMTNWDYYEAVRRFHKVLDVSGISASLRKRGVKEGDTVIIGGASFGWSDDQSDAALYAAWAADLKSRGRAHQGSARWPRVG